MADASQVNYGPESLIDWESSADPGGVDGALDQLARRVPTVFHGYDATGGQTFDNSIAVTVNIDTSKLNGNTDVFALASDAVTISDAGNAHIMFQVSIATTGTGNYTAEAWLELNGSEVTDSRVYLGREA